MGREFPRQFGRMDERVALVTGASSGIGAAITTALLDAGARVHAVARRADLIVEVVGQQTVNDGRCVPHSIDVADTAAMEKLGRELAASDPIDTLICAAGMNVPARRLSQLTYEVWDEIVAVNLSGVFYALKATIDQLRDNHGDFVVISSVAATWPDHTGGGLQRDEVGIARTRQERWTRRTRQRRARLDDPPRHREHAHSRQEARAPV